MDWNKSNTILIVAFIIVNIFLAVVTFTNIFTNTNTEVEDKAYIEDVKKILKTKNIEIDCNIPTGTYFMPFLEAEYEIIEPNNNVVQKFLGEGVEAKEGVYQYTNDANEILMIVDNKKIYYTKRDPVLGKIEDEGVVEEFINKFVEEKQIDKEGFEETYRYFSQNENYIIYDQVYEENSIDNSYMVFHIDEEGVYKYETQRIKKITEKSTIRSITAIDALLRLMTHDDVSNKKVIDMKISYYSKEGQNWADITKNSLDLTWKVFFDDGSYEHLTSDD